MMEAVKILLRGSVGAPPSKEAAKEGANLAEALIDKLDRKIADKKANLALKRLNGHAKE